MFEVAKLIELVNMIVIAVLLIEVGVILWSFRRRLLLYREAHMQPDPILRRGLVLIGGLAILGVELAVVRFLGIMFDPNSVERLAFIILTSLPVLVPLGYYAKVEYELNDMKIR